MEANGYNIQVMEMWPDPPSIWKDLTEWALQENITRTAFNNLLQKISKHDIPVPLDSRTLLKLPRAVEVITKCDGEYIYLGVESGVTRLISKFPDSFQKRDIKRDLNVDGISLFSSSSGQMWPILCRVMKFEPFVVGSFYGTSKPDPVDDYLYDLVEELKVLENKNINVFNHLLNFRITVNAFICDAPARQMLKNIKSHTGFYSCERCEIRGNSVDHRLVFPFSNPLARFRNDRIQSPGLP